MPSRALRRAAPPSDPLSPVPQWGKQPPGRPWTTSAEYPLMSLQWEGTIFLLEATGGCGNWGSRFGSASQVAIASSFSDPLRICISDSDECCGGPWSFSPDSELTPQPCCLLHDLRVRPSIMHQHCKCSLEKKQNILSVPPWCHIKPQGDFDTHETSICSSAGPTGDLDSGRWQQMAAWLGDSGSQG